MPARISSHLHAQDGMANKRESSLAVSASSRSLACGMSRNVTVSSTMYRPDVGLLVHRHDVRMHMGDIAAGEQQRDTGNAIQALHDGGEFLSDHGDRCHDIGRNFVETGKVLMICVCPGRIGPRSRKARSRSSS